MGSLPLSAVPLHCTASSLSTPWIETKERAEHKRWIEMAKRKCSSLPLNSPPHACPQLTLDRPGMEEQRWGQPSQGRVGFLLPEPGVLWPALLLCGAKLEQRTAGLFLHPSEAALPHWMAHPLQETQDSHWPESAGTCSPGTGRLRCPGERASCLEGLSYLCGDLGAGNTAAFGAAQSSVAERILIQSSGRRNVLCGLETCCMSSETGHQEGQAEG